MTNVALIYQSFISLRIQSLVNFIISLMKYSLERTKNQQICPIYDENRKETNNFFNKCLNMFSLMYITYNNLYFMTWNNSGWFPPFAHFFYSPYCLYQFIDYENIKVAQNPIKLQEQQIIPSDELEKNQKIKIQNDEDNNIANQHISDKGKIERAKKTKRKKRDQDYRAKAQKKDRNMNSIIIKNFSNYFHKNPCKESLFDKIVDKHNISIEFDQFYAYFKKKMPIGKSYLGINEFLSLISSQEYPKLSLISRIIFKKYLSLQVFPAILLSNKIQLGDKLREIRYKSTLIEQINKKFEKLARNKSKNSKQDKTLQGNCNRNTCKPKKFIL